MVLIMLILILTVLLLLSKTTLYVPVVTLSAKGNQKLSKLLTGKFERSVYWKECKTKNENKNMTDEYRYFLESNFVGVNRFLGGFIQIKITIQKHIKPKGIIYQKALSRMMSSST